MDTDAKLDKILDKLGEHSVILERHGIVHEQNAKELAHHILRTSLLEEHMETEHKEMKSNLEVALQPIKWAKLTVKIAAGAASIYGFLKLIGVL